MQADLRTMFSDLVVDSVCLNNVQNSAEECPRDEPLIGAAPPESEAFKGKDRGEDPVLTYVFIPGSNSGPLVVYIDKEN